MNNKSKLRELLQENFQDQEKQIDHEKYTKHFDEFTNKLNSQSTKVGNITFIKPLYKYIFAAFLIIVLFSGGVYFYPRYEQYQYEELVQNKQVPSLGKISASQALKLINAQQSLFDRKDIIISLKEESIAKEKDRSEFKRTIEEVNDKQSIRRLSKSTYQDQEDGYRVNVYLNTGTKEITFHDDKHINELQTVTIENLNPEDFQKYAKCGFIREEKLEGYIQNKRDSLLADTFNRIKSLDFQNITEKTDANGSELYVVRSDSSGKTGEHYNRTVIETLFNKEDFRMVRQEALFYKDNELVNSEITNYEYKIYERTKENFETLFSFDEKYDSSFDITEKTIDCNTQTLDTE